MSPKRQLMSMDRKTFKRLMGPMVDILRREVWFPGGWFLMQIPRVTCWWAFDRSVFLSDQRPFWDDLKDRRHKGILVCFFRASGSFSIFLFWLCTSKRQAVRYDATRQSSSGVWEVFEFCVGNSCRCRVQMCLSAQHHSFTSLGARSDRRTKPQTNFKAVRNCPLGCHVLHFKHHTIFAMRDNGITRSAASRLFFSVSLPKELRGGPTMSRMSQWVFFFMSFSFGLFIPCQTQLADQGWQLTTATLKQSMLIRQRQIFYHFLKCWGLCFPQTAICDASHGCACHGLGPCEIQSSISRPKWKRLIFSALDWIMIYYDTLLWSLLGGGFKVFLAFSSPCICFFFQMSGSIHHLEWSYHHISENKTMIKRTTEKLPGKQIGRPYFGGNLGLGAVHLQPSTLTSPWRQIHIDVARYCCKHCKTLVISLEGAYLKDVLYHFWCWCSLKKSGQIYMHLFLGFKGQGLSFFAKKVSSVLEPNISPWQGWKSDNQSNQSNESNERPVFHSSSLKASPPMEWSGRAQTSPGARKFWYVRINKASWLMFFSMIWRFLLSGKG